MSVSPLSKPGEPVLLQPKRSVGGIYFDIVIEENHEDSLQITEHPVEQGASISDHAFKKPSVVTIRAGASDSSEQAGDGGERHSVDIYNKLLELQAKREPCDIITGKRKYSNMLLATVSTLSDATTENALIVSMECREVIIVATKTMTVPPRNRQKKASTGATADKGQKQPVRQSMGAAATGGGKVYNKNSPNYKGG